MDLVPSGHTHGGQVVLSLAGAPVLSVTNQAYASGLVRSPRGTPVLIARGIGWAVYRVRFSCLPQIAVLESIPQRNGMA